jgi:putative nucleotidyltransferase with HDIG domain
MAKEKKKAEPAKPGQAAGGAGGEAAAPQHQEAKATFPILWQFLTVALAVSVIPLLVASWQLISINRVFLEDELLTLHSQVARSASQEISTQMEGVLGNLELVARAQGAGSPLTREERERSLFFYISQYPEVVRLTLAGSDGGVLAWRSRIGREKMPELDERERARAVAEAAGGRTYLSDPFVPPGQKLPMMLVAIPVQGTDGREGPVLLGEISLERVQKTIEGITVRRQGNAYLVDRRGVLVAHQDRERVAQGEDMNAIEIVGKYLRPGVSAGTIPFKDKSGKDMVGSYATVAGTGWGVVVQEPRDDAYATIRQMTWQAAIMIVIALLLATGAATLLSWRLARPVRHLVEKVRALGGGNFTTRVDIRSRSEVGELAGTFNQMAERLERYDRNMRELFISTIKALAAAIDAKDPYTRGHSQRVAQISLEIAKELGLSPSDQQMVNIAALLHDVGKIGIEDRILQKPTDLTPDEYKVIRQHPRWGGVILGPIRQLKEAIPSIVAHHERLDGSGYPEGVKGASIPLGARIIAVADTYDAMTTERLYQKATEPSFVIEKLSEWKGTRYDPVVVDAMARVFTRMKKA